MIRKIRSHKRAVAALVCLSCLVAALASAVVAGTRSRERPSTCVLEVNAPAQANVVIDGRDFGQHRRFTFRQLSPGVTYRCRVQVQFADEHEEQALDIQAGQTYRIAALENIAAMHDVAEPADDRSRAGRSVTAMGLDLYRQLARQPGNIVVSPLSLESILALTSEGARGATLEQMAGVLHLAPGGTQHAALAALLTELQQIGSCPGDTQAAHGGLQLGSALWIQTGDSLARDFVSLARDRYGAHLEQVDFAGDAQAARQRVNRWAATLTHERIRELIAAGSPSADTRLLLTSALYFRGDWAFLFDREETAPAAFRPADTEQISVPTMALRARLRHCRDGKVQILELPYADQRLAMLVVLPNEPADLSGVESALSGRLIAKWVRRLTAADVVASIPSFQIDWSGSLKNPLAEMGMPAAFGTAADFGGISRQHDLFIGDFVHRAWIAVDEQGSQAAAAAAVTMAPKSFLGNTVEFRADHPFLFVIYDTASGGSLFVGRLADPRTG
ncbi:MAG: serpin family protein [Pirellulales bacterium]